MILSDVRIGLEQTFMCQNLVGLARINSMNFYNAHAQEWDFINI